MSDVAPFPTLWQSFRQGAADCVRGLGELVFPWHCELCEADCRGGPFCPDCRDELRERTMEYAAKACPRCGMPVGPFVDLLDGCGTCRRRRFRFDEVFALGPYEESLRTLCLKLKHDQSAWLGPRLGNVLAELRLEGGDIPPAGWGGPGPVPWRQRGTRR